jgi:hypothetical protein
MSTLCYFCTEPIEKGDVNLHHPVYKSKGGTHVEPSHADCHRSFHSERGDFVEFGRRGGLQSAITRRWSFNLRGVKDHPAYDFDRTYYLAYYAHRIKRGSREIVPSYIGGMMDIQSYPKEIERAAPDLAATCEELSETRDRIKEAEIEALASVMAAKGENDKPLYSNDKARDIAVFFSLRSDSSYNQTGHRANLFLILICKSLH